MKRASRHQGFTLIELLIVVVILGIIASIVIPQFTMATDDALLSTMKTNLATVRAQLQLYKVEHNNEYPPMTTDPLLAEMAKQTKIDHTDGGDIGPYLVKIPDNPYTETADINDTKVVDADGSNKSAWYYNSADANNIVFRANDTEARHDNY